MILEKKCFGNTLIKIITDNRVLYLLFIFFNAMKKTNTSR